ncbi:myosin-11-like [Uranotaenia lowii]|uniref:myosin-11-like n=1 Tax=Uranotaenia lowii TaxID=190385 RepID=UPI002478674D|nr:myosin-11-like [Uranotaenia lowii]
MSSTNSNSCLDDPLCRKISDHIVSKNRQLRRLSQLLLVDTEYLRFSEIALESEWFLDEHCCRFVGPSLPTDIGLSYLKIYIGKLRLLQLTGRFCLRRIYQFARVCAECEDEQFVQVLTERVSSTTEAFCKNYSTFVKETQELIFQLPEIYLIGEFENQLVQTEFLYSVVVKNQSNLSDSNPLKLQRSFVIQKLDLLKRNILTEYRQTITQYLELVNEMEPIEPGASLESVRTRLADEINRSRTDLVIADTELVELRKELFSSTVISLREQRDVIVDHLEAKELDLEQRIQSIEALQTDIESLEDQVSKLIAERERVQGELRRKRDTLRQGIREVVRLEKLIQKIEMEISERTEVFQEKLEELERKRLNILNDPNLTEEERQRLLAQMENEVRQLVKDYQADQTMLKDKTIDLRALSMSIAEDMEALKGELEKKHLDELRELEERKKNATPSELELINARIAELQQEFEENMDMLQRAQARVKYYEDEFGRYYINEKGQKVYQRDSAASEYILNADGQWEKVREALDLKTDEKGLYYIDKFGRKIYSKKFFEDEYGKYYVDADGKRVYLEQSSMGDLAQSSEATKGSLKTFPSFSESSMTRTDLTPSEMAFSEKMKEQRASDVKYVQDAIGPALTKALALAFLQQPEDPIEFIAKYLEKYHQKQEEESARAELLSKVCSLKEEMAEKINKPDDDECSSF